MKSMTTPPKISAKGPTNRPEPKSKAAESRAVEREKRWREVTGWFRSVASEMKRVTWPSRDEWVAATMVVVGLVVIVALWTRLISWIAELIFHPNGA
ncbi:MAG: preprotein translocase subunit SecE [Candidatus Eremiobacteraeota bacterium]|nr:preprotein translocase subunit SecE [Candidatus Eremiobacteraeota bacterium]MBV8671491.1 preprotein translocase subunit SecE [Candidatus Eremiobacteraeota bacterium]